MSIGAAIVGSVYQMAGAEAGHVADRVLSQRSFIPDSNVAANQFLRATPPPLPLHWLRCLVKGGIFAAKSGSGSTRQKHIIVADSSFGFLKSKQDFGQSHWVFPDWLRAGGQ